MAFYDNDHMARAALAGNFAEAGPHSLLPHGEVIHSSDHPESAFTNGEPMDDEAFVDITKGEVCELLELYPSPKSTCKCCTEWVEEKPFQEHHTRRKAAESKFATFAINRQQHSHESGWKTSALVIHSSHIQSALAKVFENYPVSYATDFRLVLEAKFLPFVHRWPKFLEVEEEEQDAIARSHLSLLRSTLASELAEDFQRLEYIKTTGFAEFEDLQLVYAPGDIVMRKHDHGTEAAILRGLDLVRPMQGPPFYSADVEVVNWSGKKFGLEQKTWTIGHFKGGQRLSELSVALLHLLADQGSIRKILIERGREFERLNGQHFKYYSGTVSPLSFSWFHGGDREISERVVVDIEGYYATEATMPPGLKPLDGSASLQNRTMPYTDYGHMLDPLSIHDTTEHAPAEKVAALTDDQCLIASPTVLGFALTSKEWFKMRVDRIKEISFIPELMNKLVLDQDEKALILGCTNKSLDPLDFDDFIPGKGRGVILLFCGPPGVGKTLAAESVPEHLQRPLYRLGMADLSTSVTAVETSLKTALTRCSRWDATLLIDEADVFLETRSTNDLQRNELVSIFLRLLEYYEGIMILTTNRTMSIDPAFESRIDITLAFDDLSEDARRQIWLNFLRELGSRSALTDDDVQKLARVPLNGRQIKSAIKTALTVYGAGGTPLILRHFEVVINNRNKAAKLLSGKDRSDAEG